jgi:hypothetical protein
MKLDCAQDIPGAPELINWFGHFPSCHDANVVKFAIHGDGSGLMEVDAHQMTDKVDAKGYFVLDKHCRITFRFDGIQSVQLADFRPGQAILYDLKISRSEGEFLFGINTSYGFAGHIRMKSLRVEFSPRPTS